MQIPSFNYKYVWVFINSLIPLIGIWGFNWSIGFVIFLIVYELFLGGIFGCLKILTALDNKKNYLSNVGGRIGSLIFFVFTYYLLFILLTVWLLKPMDTDSIFKGSFPNSWSFRFVTINYMILFITEFLLNGKFRTASPATIGVSGMLYFFPLAILIMFVINPLAGRLNSSHVNYFMISCFILLRAGLDMLVVYFHRNDEFIEKRISQIRRNKELK